MRATILALLVMGATVANAGTPTTSVVTTLGFVETSEVHLFHAGLLWVGRTTVTQGVHDSIEAYRADGTLVRSLTLPHSAMHAAVYDAKSIIVTGRTSDPQWETHYSIIASDFSVRTYTFPAEIQIEYFTGGPNDMYFSQFGDASVLRWAPSQKQLSPYVSLPGEMAKIGSTLFVIERRVNDLASSLVNMDVNTETSGRLWPEYSRNAIAQLLPIQNNRWLAVTEKGAGLVHLVNPSTVTEERTLKVPEASGIAEWGSCLIVSSEDARQISIFDVRTQVPTLVATWDLSHLGNVMTKARTLAVDPASGKLFVRSTYVCPQSNCQTPQSGVVAAQDQSGALRTKCF